MNRVAKISVLALLAVVIGAVLLTTLVDHVLRERENNRHVNSAIFSAFDAIENRCLQEQFPHETVRCQTALQLMKRCFGPDSCPVAIEYYDELVAAGFKLPPFYESGYVPK
jgi:hypothetical protein